MSYRKKYIEEFVSGISLSWVGWSWFFAGLRVSSKGYYHFRCMWPEIPKLSKITSLLFLCNRRNKLVKKQVHDVVDFLHADKHEKLATNWY